MPLYEYVCKDCRKRFEALVYGSQAAQCPLCHGSNLDQQISVFSVGSAHSVAACTPEACPSAGGCCAGDACKLYS
jgi:putative FmdB family regulatory protein